MRPIHLDGVTADQLSERDELYNTTHDARVRIRALMVLLAAQRQIHLICLCSFISLYVKIQRIKGT